MSEFLEDAVRAIAHAARTCTPEEARLSYMATLQAVAEAAAEGEREACAKVAESPDHRHRDVDDTMAAIAAAIRARCSP